MKKDKLPFKIIMAIVGVLTLLSSAYTSLKLWRYGGLETSLRLIAILIVILIALILAMISIKIGFSKTSYRKKGKTNFGKIAQVVIIIALSITYIGGNIAASGLLVKVEETLDDVSISEETYVGAIVVLAESKATEVVDLKDKKIGYFDMKTSMEGYIVPLLILEDSNIDQDVELLPYENLNYLIAALYDGHVDAIMVAESYGSMFENVEGFKDINTRTKILETKEEVQEIVNTNNGNIKDLEKDRKSVV